MIVNLMDLGRKEQEEAARAIHNGIPLAIDCGPAMIVFKACPNYEVDFICASRNPIDGETKQQLIGWAKRNVPGICRVWRELFPKAVA